jgi:hypothetical protein
VTPTNQSQWNLQKMILDHLSRGGKRICSLQILRMRVERERDIQTERERHRDTEREEDSPNPVLAGAPAPEVAAPDEKDPNEGLESPSAGFGAPKPGQKVISGQRERPHQRKVQWA